MYQKLLSALDSAHSDSFHDMASEEDEEDEDDKYLFYSPLFGFIGGSKKLDRRILKIAIAVFIGPWVVAAIFFLGLFLV